MIAVFYFFNINTAIYAFRFELIKQKKIGLDNVELDASKLKETA